jgi:hypothetical protein
MYKDLENYNLTKFTEKFIANVKQKRQLLDVATEYDCHGASNVVVPVFTGGQATPHATGSKIPSFGGEIEKATIVVNAWDAAAYLDRFLLDQENFTHENAVQNTLIPSAVCNRMDQTIIDALNRPSKLPTVEGGTDLLALFADIKALMDKQEAAIPAEDRSLILPAAAQPEFFTNDKFMSNDYMQWQLSNLSEGKIGKILGMNLIFLNDLPDGGLTRELADGGANVIWTCYAVSKVCVGHAVGYGANRSADGTGASSS